MALITRERALMLAVGALFGFAGPAAASALRALRARETRKARQTRGTADDEFWEVAGPAIDRIADLLDRGDLETAHREVVELTRVRRGART
jgi:hypothetical protein